jgi:hypothetical protein
MTLWNGSHGADSAVVPSELVFRAVSLEVSVSDFTTFTRSDLAIDVLVR